jgi:hypothetical protein
MRTLVAAAVASMALAGCGAPHHLSPRYGASYRGHFRVQTIDPDAGRASQPTVGLDSQEAAMVAKGYRDSLAREGQVLSEDEPVILLPTEGVRGAR